MSINRLLLVILCLTCSLPGISQPAIQNNDRVHYILRQAVAHVPGLTIYGRRKSNTLVNIAVLNDKNQRLYWLTCHGRAFDSAQLTSQEYQQLTNHTTDPFQLYEQICLTYTEALEEQKDIIRRQIRYAARQASTQQPDINGLTVSPEILKQLNEINSTQKANRVSLAYFQCPNPHSLHDKPAYHIYAKQTGAVITLRDTVSFYNRDPLAYAYKIEINPSFPDRLLVSNRNQGVIDSLPLLSANISQIKQEKTDVFALYYRWLRAQWEKTRYQALSYRYRYDSMLIPRWSYIRYRENKPELSVVDSLYQQMVFWEGKLTKATAPDEQTVQQAVYEAYTGEPYEMVYMPGGIWGYSYVVIRGNKVYELTNHLGNVLATVSDRRIPFSANGITVNYYNADVVSAQDYYPFGMLQPGRAFNASGYRYGFNGKENDNEVKGDGNQQDYGMRIYDPRVGRFLSVDPLTKQYPHYTPYSFAGNDVLRNIDLDGGEKKHYLLAWDESHKNATLTFSHAEDFTETTTNWTPTWSNWTKTTSTTVKNPRVEYVVHGTVSVPMSADGMFKDDIQAATWTFATAEEMYGKETARRAAAEKGPHSWGPSHEWGYASSDQHWNIALGQMATYGVEAQATKDIYSPNVYSGLYNQPKNVYRFDTRNLEEIQKAGGFNSWGYDMNLLEHANGNTIFDQTSGYVPTTFSLKSLAKYAKGRTGYAYKLEWPANGINVNKTLGSKSPFPAENEIAVPLNIPASSIKSVKKIGE